MGGTCSVYRPAAGVSSTRSKSSRIKGVPEESAYLPLFETGDINMAEGGLVEVKCRDIVAVYRARKLWQIYKSI